MIFDEDVHFTSMMVIGGYIKRATKRMNLVTILEDPISESMQGALCTYQIQDEGGYKCTQMTGFIMGVFAERFRAAKPGEEFRWRNAVYKRMPLDQVHKLINDGPYKMAVFGL